MELMDDTFVVAAPARLSDWLRDPAQWRRWWPELTLHVFMDRGEAGIRWSATGSWRGSAEVWLEPVLDGTVVHLLLRLDPAKGSLPARAAARRREQHANRWKAVVWAVKDDLERGRVCGKPALGDLSESGPTPTIRS